VFCFQLSEMRNIYDFIIEKDQPLEKDHPLGFCVVDFFTIPRQEASCFPRQEASCFPRQEASCFLP